MKMRISSRTPLMLVLATTIVVLVATTIYVSAASRQAPQPSVSPIDATNVPEVLAFDPFEPQKAGGIDTQVASTSGQAVEQTVAAEVPGRQIALAVEPPLQHEQLALSLGPKKSPVAGKTIAVPKTAAAKAAAAKAAAGKVTGAKLAAGAVTPSKGLAAAFAKGGFFTTKLGVATLVGGGVAAVGGIAAVTVPIVSSDDDDDRSSASP